MAELLSDADVGIAPAPSKGKDTTGLLSDEDIGLGKRMAFTPGQEKYAQDEATLAKNRGIVPDAAKAAGWSAANTALLYGPRAASAAYTAYTENKPYSQALKEQTEYEEALSRQNPKASMAGTGAGLVGGLLVPLGPLATAGRAAGAATAAKLGTTAGKVAEGATIGSALSGVSGLLETGDPMAAVKDAALGAGIGGAAAPALGALGRYFTKLPAVLDSSGNLVPEAQNAIRTAFEGRMSQEAIKSFENELVSAFQKKGISPEVAKEALLVKEGVTPTRSLVTGEAAPKVTEDIAAKSAAEGTEALARKAEALIGKPPERTEVAEALAPKVRGAISEAESIYEANKVVPGQFGELVGPVRPVTDPTQKGYGQVQFSKEVKPGQFEDVFMPADRPVRVQDTFLPSIQESLAKANLPTSFENTGKESYTKAKQALQWMERGPARGNYPLMDELTPKNIQEILKNLNDYSAGAVGTDRYAVKAIKHGFMDAIKKHVVDPALFSGDGKTVFKNLEDAPAAWSAMKSIYFPDVGDAAAQFRKTVNSFVDQSTRRISENPTQGMIDTAQSAINSNLLSKKLGSSYYEMLEKALGKGSPEMATVNQHIRSIALDTGGDLSKLPGKINDFLKDSPTLAQRVFKPNELADLRRISEAAKLITKRPIPQQEKDDLLAKLVGKAIRYGAAGLGQVIHGPMGALVGYLGTAGAEKTTEALSTGFKRSAEKAGAPKTRKAPEPLRRFETAPSGASAIRNIPALAPVGVEGYQEPTMMPPLTIRRASGGRVAAKLVSEVERAKKSVNNSTKALLNADDSHVARALEIANQNLEG